MDKSFKDFEFHEKLYFHEIDSREQLNGRLQTPLGLIMALIAVIAFMLQNLDKRPFEISTSVFWFLFCYSIVALGISIYYFVRSWYGNIYKFMPSAKVIEEYRSVLIDTYKGYDKGEVLAFDYFEAYLKQTFVECSSINTDCNDQRSIYVHKTNTYLIIASISAFLAFFCFYVFDLSKSEENEIRKVKIIDSVEMKQPLSKHPDIIVNLPIESIKIQNRTCLPGEVKNDKGPKQNASTSTSTSTSTTSNKRRCESSNSNKG